MSCFAKKLQFSPLSAKTTSSSLQTAPTIRFCFRCPTEPTIPQFNSATSSTGQSTSVRPPLLKVPLNRDSHGINLIPRCMPDCYAPTVDNGTSYWQAEAGKGNQAGWLKLVAKEHPEVVVGSAKSPGCRN